MLKSLKVILDIQELDIKMIRLMRLKKERQAELEKIKSIRDDLHHQTVIKESEIIELKKQIRLSEGEISEIVAKIKKLESQQNSVKKVEEFNALNQEIGSLEKEKSAKEQRLSDLYDKLAAEEDLLKNLRVNLDSAKESSLQLEKEISVSIHSINQEGSQLKIDRSALLDKADAEVLKVYEKLLKNKKDRVIVPIEARCCSGCHILVTAQHENLVRKGERLVFCEHCSRIHYWQESMHSESSSEDSATSTRRRRRPAKI